MREQGQRFLGWRSVPVNATTLGKTSRACMPVIRQAFIERSADIDDEEAFERKLYLIRKIAEKRLRYAPDAKPGDFYAASLSCRTIVYKGMLLSRQVAQLYLDLNDLSYDTAIALVHSQHHPWQLQAHECPPEPCAYRPVRRRSFAGVPHRQ